DPESPPLRPNFSAMQLSSASSDRRPSASMAGRPIVSTIALETLGEEPIAFQQVAQGALRVAGLVGGSPHGAAAFEGGQPGLGRRDASGRVMSFPWDHRTARRTSVGFLRFSLFWGTFPTWK